MDVVRVLLASTMARPVTLAIDGDSPTTEGILTAHVQVMDAFDATRVNELRQTLENALGPEIHGARLEPHRSHDIRGGAYLLGATHRRAWNVSWEKLPHDMRGHLDRAELDEIKDTPGELIVQWADHVPFALVLLRIKIPCDAGRVGRAAEQILDTLPGRLEPSNRIPRSEAQIVVCAKISDRRMKRIRARMQGGDEDEALCEDLSAGLRIIGKVAGNVRLESAASNVLIAEGHAWSTDDRLQGPFRAFLSSKGNLGPHPGWEWHIPMWIPSGLGGHDWTSFNFHPFLLGAIRHARHVAVEAGRVDETLSRASRLLPGNDAYVNTDTVPKGLHGELVALHTRLQRLSTTHHLCSTRSQVGQREGEWAGHLRYEAQTEEAWPMMRGIDRTSDALRADKAQAEQESQQVLESIERRLARSLDLVTIVENRNLNHSMRFWTIAAAILAATSIIVALIVR